MSPLYEQWLRTANARGAAFALCDRAAGESWTFGEMRSLVEAMPVSDGPAFPSGMGAGFIFEVLRVWRDGGLLCPLERGVTRPELPEGPTGGVCHLKLTSGSTGAPRLIQFGPDQLAADARNLVATMRLQPEWPNLGVISMAHSYGFSNLVLTLLLHGIPLVLLGDPLPGTLASALAEWSQVTLPAVPAMWRAWDKSGVISPSIRLAISAGAPLALDLERGIHAVTGLKVHNFLGASECGGIAYDRDDAPRTDAGFVGTPIDNVTLSVGDDGCLVVEGDAVGTGYAGGSDAALAAGRFRTTDLAEIVDGSVFVRGRRGDVINVAGRKVAPARIEEALLAVPGVRYCVVFGVPSRDPERVQDVAACVCPGPGFDLSGVKPVLRSRLAAWEIPRIWWKTGELRPDARGKISRSLWRRRFQESRG